MFNCAVQVFFVCVNVCIHVFKIMWNICTAVFNYGSGTSIVDIFIVKYLH